jgi:ferritin-like metal-binding protein YciE
MSDLKELYFESLKDLYDAEHRIIEALPQMAKEASSSELKTALETHLEETKEQVSRLEKVFQLHDKEAEREKCKAMKGLITEGEDHLKDWKGEDYVKDAVIIASAQKVEHYEIAGYGTAKCYAQLLGFDRDVEILDETLSEEKNADMKLTDIAIEDVNPDALAQKTGEKKAGRNPNPSQTIAP